MQALALKNCINNQALALPCADSRVTAVTLPSSKTVSYTYDNVGRVSQKTLGLSNPYNISYTYHPGADGSQTTLLETYHDPYEYEYDNNANITKIMQGSVVIDYLTLHY